MQTIERELSWAQPRPSVKDHLFIGGLNRLFPARALAGTRGSRWRAAIEHKEKAQVSLNNSAVTLQVAVLTEASQLQWLNSKPAGGIRQILIEG